MATIRDANGFRALTSSILDRVRSGVEDAVGRGLGIIADEASARCPVDSGELRDTVRTSAVEVAGDVVSGSVIAGGQSSHPHVMAVEYGTAEMRAEPFLRPALAAAAPKFREVVIEAINRSL